MLDETRRSSAEAELKLELIEKKTILFAKGWRSEYDEANNSYSYWNVESPDCTRCSDLPSVLGIVYNMSTDRILQKTREIFIKCGAEPTMGTIITTSPEAYQVKFDSLGEDTFLVRSDALRVMRCDDLVDVYDCNCIFNVPARELRITALRASERIGAVRKKVMFGVGEAPSVVSRAFSLYGTRPFIGHKQVFHHGLSCGPCISLTICSFSSSVDKLYISANTLYGEWQEDQWVWDSYAAIGRLAATIALHIRSVLPGIRSQPPTLTVCAHLYKFTKLALTKLALIVAHMLLFRAKQHCDCDLLTEYT